MGDHARSPRVALLLFLRPAGPTDKARDYGSRDSGFESQVGLLNPDYSSVGRAIDCRSIGHVFDSHWPDKV